MEGRENPQNYKKNPSYLRAGCSARHCGNLGLVALPPWDAIDVPREVQVTGTRTWQGGTNTVAVWPALPWKERKKKKNQLQEDE